MKKFVKFEFLIYGGPITSVLYHPGRVLQMKLATSAVLLMFCPDMENVLDTSASDVEIYVAKYNIFCLFLLRDMST